MIDTTQYKARLKAKHSAEQDRKFAKYGRQALESRISVLNQVKLMFPMFWELFEEQLTEAEPAWFHAEKDTDNRMGSPGIVMDGLIFCPSRDSGGYKYLEVGIYCADSPARGTWSIRQGDEDTLASCIDKLNSLMEAETTP